MTNRKEGNMEEKKQCSVVVAPQLIKEKTFITENGEVIHNTPEDPRAVENYLRSKRGL
jgi:hypothetical protein